MRRALELARALDGMTSPNPAVGCVLVKDGRVVGRGRTRNGGRPHGEAVALAAAGEAARGATAYVTLEPCAHVSRRGPSCADLLIAAGVARVVAALTDPDPRTAGQGLERLRAAGIAVSQGPGAGDAAIAAEGFFAHQRLGRPHVTLKLAASLDGRIALPSGESRWITGPEARAHGHLLRSRSEAVLVGRGTFDADQPRLDVRLAGLENRAPRRLLLTSGAAPEGWEAVPSPGAIAALAGVDHLLVEGGAGAAAAFLADDLVDRLLIYRAPIILGAGPACVGDLGLAGLAEAHGRWQPAGSRRLGSDRLEVYHRRRDND
jgi:diaminohydroxyphosphoribosylaminopyrimidine deaminase/5-amino-6-(5-phosphoribosylamino)uracil reductase